MAKKELDVVQLLKLAGLDRRESAFYAAALSLGKGLVSQVAQVAELNRSAAYEVMASLKEKGLISTTQSSRGLTVLPSNPEHLLHAQKERYDTLANHIEDLQYLFSVAKQEPGVRMYEGKEGLKEVLQVILDEGEDVCIYGDGEAFKQSIPGWTDRYVDERNRRAIRARVLLKGTLATIASVKSIMSKKTAKAHFTQMRVLPESLGIVGGFDIVGQKIALYSFDSNPVAVMIESKFIAAMMKSVFEMLWTMAEPYQRTLLL